MQGSMKNYNETEKNQVGKKKDGNNAILVL